MGDEPAGLNLSLDDIIKKQQENTTRGGDDRRNRQRGQRQGNFNNGSQHAGNGGDFDMVGGGGGGPVRRHNDAGRDRVHHNRPVYGGGDRGSDRLAGRLRDTSGHDPRSDGSYHGGDRRGSNRNFRGGQIDYREFQKCFVEYETGVVVFKYRGGHLEANIASLNDALNCIGIRITAPSGDPSSGEWSISDGKSLTRYTDGVVIPAKGASWRAQQVLDAFKNPNRGAATAASNAAASNMGVVPGYMPMPGMHSAMAMGYGGRGGRGRGRGRTGQRFTPY